MALAKIVRVNSNSYWAAWKVEEAPEVLITHTQLPANNLAEWQSIKHPRKRLEWLASRAALAALLEKIGLPIPGIYKDDKGKPYLNNDTYHISLANTYPYGIAMVHTHASVGIDIELPSDKLLRTQHKFLNSSEIKTADNRLSYLCAYWCAKEALYKLYGRKALSFKDQIRIRSLSLDDGIRVDAEIINSAADAQYRLEGTIIDDLYVIYVVI
ncbi:MAG: 4'-phosphopantetheinyl transferase superfamily protein [Tunicatimonas sp.]